MSYCASELLTNLVYALNKQNTKTVEWLENNYDAEDKAIISSTKEDVISTDKMTFKITTA